MKDQASSTLNNKRKFHPYENQRSMDLKKAQHTASGLLKKPNSQTLTKNNVPKRTKGLKPSHDQPQQTNISQPLQRQRGSGIRTNQRVMALSPDAVARYNELRSSLDKEKASTFRKSTNSTPPQYDSTTPVHNMVLSPSSPVFEIDTQNVACFSDISIMIMDEGFALSESDFSEFKEHVMECDEVFWKQPTMEPMIQWDEEIMKWSGLIL
ncbi:hypothetical protein C9374_002390 [Naegleria lovaniensis]|uniref:Uncharacterized protein n=1 Tax=Naegleria lovaniensis TaxID=51637 RepID=A0AA88GVK8_NAELO|nr:uncharacterized protein C9374_002390 [Naegleria lovaniensis]KAG2386646.1 hypothetical protein C9374_002390 [Naegleria lovaniensis]